MTENYRSLTVHELEILWDLSRYGSLRALARANGLQASHVSKILARIEKKLGTSVVQRSAKGVVLTPDGIRLAAVARSLVESARKLSLQTEAAQEPAQLVSIAGARFICNDLVAPALESLREGSGLRFRLLDMSPDQIEPAAFRSACELAILMGDSALSPAWEVRKLGSLTWGLYASSAHPLGVSASEQEILEFPFVVPNYWTGKHFEEGNDQCPVPWNERLRGDETSSIATGLEIVALSSQQVVFAPRLAVQNAVARKELREISVKGWPRVSKTVSIAARADRVSQKLFREMQRVLKARLV